jgi:preprotein translocase subunit SecA
MLFFQVHCAYSINFKPSSFPTCISMFEFINKALASVFGSKSERDIKEILPYVTQTNVEWHRLTKLSADQLRAETFTLKEKIKAGLQDIHQQLADLEKQAENPEIDLNEKEKLFGQIDLLQKEKLTIIETLLLDMLPVAFAIVKETARRFKENASIRVKALDYDRALALTRDHISIEGDEAVWKNKWGAAGNEITWDMVHYDVQLIGGVALHKGKIAEMATGEGKTLVATLPAFLNALAGEGVHIVTVNDYLAKRDSEWMGPIYEFHGLKVDCIDKHEPNSDRRKQAYQADITFGTNNEFGFDYLRDNGARSPEELVQRKHHFAMVDEVDSVLIDDARTPLIISGPVPRGDRHEFQELKPRVFKLVEEQKKLVSEFLIQAKKDIQAGNEKEGGLALFRAHRGLPKYKPLIKFLSETGMKALLQKTENIYLEDNQRRMPEADEPLFFTIDERNNSIELTEKGVDLITGAGEDPHFFILPDIGTELNALEQDKSLDGRSRSEKKEKLIQDYHQKSERIHTVNQLLKAYTLFEKDVDYIIVESKVKIVDEQTGRVMEGRRYSDGLHQALEAKENVKVEDATQTYATITLQNYFRMYHKLAGMTGTAETEAGEFWEIYKLDVVVIPTNKTIVREDREDLVYKTMREKFNAVVDEIVTLTQQGRPVLVGTTSVEISELLSRMLNLRKIKHQVLNAKLHQKEAEIVAEAGKSGTVTIATNMAGRGTDIKLSPESKAAGGLAIIGTERHESRRVDRQLRGRSGRQGDPGSTQFFVSLEDNLMRLFGSDRIARLMDRMGLKEGEVIQHSMITKSIERAQKKVEENNFSIRKRLLEYDDVMNSQREVVYKRRRNALFGERLELDVLNMLYDTTDEIVTSAKSGGSYEEMKFAFLEQLSIEPEISQEEFNSAKQEALTHKLYEQVLEHYRLHGKSLATKVVPVFEDIYKTRGATVENVVVPISDGVKQIAVVAPLKKTLDTSGQEMVRSLEKSVSLAFIDNAWREHLRAMDDLKQSVQNAAYEQKDPLLIYKFEGFNLFKSFVSDLNKQIISFLSRAGVQVQQADDIREARKERRSVQTKEQKADMGSLLSGPAESPSQESTVKPQPVKSTKIWGRNDKVTVQYNDGRVMKDVKYKSVEDDVLNSRCVVIDS